MNFNKQNQGIELSIIIPLYNEEENIEPLYDGLTKVLAKLHKEYEIIFVDDGSKDKTLIILKRIHSSDYHVKIIKLVRNFGQIYAILTGFEMSKGNTIIVMDGDQQNDPQDIPRLLEKVYRGYSFVNGWRRKRADSILRKLCAYFANKIISYKTGIRLKDYGCALFVTKRDILESIKIFGINARFLKPMLVKIADSIVEIEVKHFPRKKGLSKYSIYRIIKSGADLLFNFNRISGRHCPPPVVIEEVIW